LQNGGGEKALAWCILGAIVGCRLFKKVKTETVFDEQQSKEKWKVLFPDKIEEAKDFFANIQASVI